VYKERAMQSLVELQKEAAVAGGAGNRQQMDVKGSYHEPGYAGPSCLPSRFLSTSSKLLLG